MDDSAIFKLIANTTFDWEYLIDPNGKFIYCSPSCQRVTGYSPEDFISNPKLLSQIVHLEDKNIFQPELKIEKQDGYLTEVEFRIIRKDGSECWIGHVSQPVFDSDRKFIGLRGSNREKSEHKLIQQIIKNSEERYKTLFEGNKDALVIFEIYPDGSASKIKQVNKAASDLLGYSKIELFDLSAYDLEFDPSSEKIKACIKKIKEEGQYTFETYLQHSNGKIIAAEVMVYESLMEGTPHLVNIIRDITQKKIAESRLQQSEEKYRTLFDNMAEGAYYQTSEGYLIDVNDAALKMLGLSRVEFLGRTSSHREWNVINEYGHEIIPSEYPSMIALNTGTSILGQTIGVFNKIIKDYVWMTINAIPQFMSGKNKPYQVFVTLHDLSERKQLENTLLKSEEKYRLITERSNELICIHDLDGTYTYISPSVERILGYTVEELWGTNPYDLFHPDDKQRILEESHKPAMEGNGNLNVEYRIRKKDGTYIWFGSLTDLVKDSDGKVVALQTSSRDISKRKATEEALRYETNLLMSLMDNIPDHIYFKDEECRFLRMNKSQADSFGLSSPLEGVGKTDFDFFEWQHAHQAFEDEKKIMATGFPLINVEEKETWPDGSVSWVSTTKLPLHNSDGRIIGTFGVSRDITEKRLDEEKIRISEEKYRKLFTEMKSGFSLNEMIFDDEGKSIDYVTIEINDAFESLLGAKREYVIGKKASEFLLPEELEHWLKIFTPVVIEGISTSYEMFSPTNDKYFEGSAYRPEVGKFAVVFSDHTEQHKAEKLIRESEEKYHLLFSKSLDGILYTEPGGKIFSANEAACKLLQMTEEEICNVSRGGILDRTDPRLQPALKERKDKGFFTGELTFQRKNGEIFPAEISSTIFKDKDGNERSNIIFRDITERKRSEEDAQLYSSTLNNIFENTPYVMLLVDGEGKMLNINRAGEEFAQGDKADLLGNLGGEIFHCINSLKKPGCGKNKECSTCPIRSKVNHTFNTKESIHNGEGHMSFRFNGEAVELDLLISTTLVKHNKQDAVLLSIIDLTERKKAELALKESEARYRTIYETAAEGILIGDVEEKIISVNQQMASILGYTIDEILGRNYKEFIVADELEDHLGKKSNRIENQGEVYERRLIKKDGSTIWCLVSASPILDNQGHYAGAFGMFTDITERKSIEEVTKLQRDFNYSLISASNLEDATKNIFHYSKQLVGIDCGGIYLLDENGGLKSIGSFGLSPKFIDYISYHQPGSPEASLAREGTTLFMNYTGIRALNISPMSNEGIKCVMAVPLLREEKVFGVFNLASKTLEDFSDYQKGNAEAFALQVGNYLKRILAEQELKQSEEKYKKFFEADLAGDFRSTNDGKLLDCNEAFIKMLEFDSKEHALATNMRSIYPSQKNRNEIYNRLKMGESLKLIETALVTMKGNNLIVLESMLAEYDTTGEVVGATGFMIDLTQIKIADKAIKESEKKYRQLFFHMQNGFAYHEIILNNRGKPVDYRFLDVNPRFENLTGLKRENIIGKTVLEVIPETEKHWIETYGTISLTQKARIFESFSKEIGKYFRINAYSPERLRFAVLIEDITEERKTEEKIRQLSLAVDQSPVSIGITDLSGKLIYVNPSFCESSGYSENELLGDNPRILKSDFANLEDYKEMWKIVNSGSDWYGVFHNKKKNGELYWESANISPIRDSAEKITHFIAIKEDITESVNTEKELELYRNNLENIVKLRTMELDTANTRLQEEILKQKEYEMMLQQSLEKEKELNELKTRFISTASHEFRTPLTSISLSSGLIQRYGKKWSEEKFNEHVTRINGSIKYLTKLLDDVLTISRTDSGKIVYEPTIVELKSFCQELITEIGGYITERHNLSFKYGLHKKDFMMDPKLLKFILSNLLSNAFKYSPHGGKVVFNVSSSKSNLIFTISDEGIGIPDTDRNHMFEPFHRSKNSIDIQGTGLGLSIVKKAIDLHNGEISYISELNKGTTFTVKIPREEVNLKPGKKTGK